MALIPTRVPSQVVIEKHKGEGLGVALVESGWGSLLPTAVIANLLHRGPAERSGALSIGDRLTAINGTSLVGLPLATVQAAIRVSSPGWQGLAQGPPMAGSPPHVSGKGHVSVPKATELPSLDGSQPRGIR